MCKCIKQYPFYPHVHLAAGLARVVRNVLSAEAKAAEKLRANGFNQKAEIYETAQREYRRLRRERRGKVRA